MKNYPECERMNSVIKESQPIGQFVDWCRENDIDARWENMEVLLARYFEIDLSKVEQERQEILASLQ